MSKFKAFKIDLCRRHPFGKIENLEFKIILKMK